MDVNGILRDMGRVLEFSNNKQAAATSRHARVRHYGSQEKSIAVTAQRLLVFACQVGWVAMSELLLPIALAMGATASQLVVDLESLADQGLTLLHHAVKSRSASLVGLLAHLPVYQSMVQVASLVLGAACAIWPSCAGPCYAAAYALCAELEHWAA